MPLNFRPQLTPVSWSLLGALSLLVLSTFSSAFAADSVVSLAQREAAKRQARLENAGSDFQKASNLMAEGKTEEALNLLESIYTALPDAPLTHESKLVARAGYVSAGCIRAEELMAAGKRPEADTLLIKLLQVSPNDKRVKDTQQRIADPDRYPPALTAEHIQNVRTVESLLLKADSAIEIGDYDLAYRLYQGVLRADTANSAARRGMERAEREKGRYYQAARDHNRAKMLGEVDRTWEDPVPVSSADLNTLFGARAQASAVTATGRDGILDKLRNYRMPRVEFQQATISEVIELLRLRSRDLDPQGRGVDFVLSLPEDAMQRPISLSLSDVPMEEVLRYVTEAAGVSYRVEMHAVVLNSLSEKNAALITRSFRVPPDFIQNVPTGPAVPAVGADPFAQGSAPAGGGVVLRRMGAKEFLESRGVTFPEGASASFTGSSSTLVVRNTANNMEMVEGLVDQAAKNSPKMAVISVRMIEVNQNNLDELGFDWLMGGVGFNGNNVFAGGGSSGNGASFNSANYPFGNAATIPGINLGGNQVFPTQNVASAVAGPIPLGVPTANAGGGGQITAGNRSGTYATGSSTLDNLLSTGSTTAQAAPAPGILSVAGVFTDPQFQTVLRGLAQKKGVDVNSSPSVTAKSGVKSTVEITREFIYPTEFDPPQLPQGNFGRTLVTVPIATPTTPTAFETKKTGMKLEVEPVISEDGRSVELVIAPELTDFEGFVNYGSPIFVPTGSSFLPISVRAGTIIVILRGVVIATIPVLANTGYVPLSQPERLITPNMILQPVFKTHKVSTAVKVWDGQTVVLGGVKTQEHTIVDDQVPILGDLPFVGGLFRTHVHRKETKNVIIFVTVNVIDPSGRKINQETAGVSR